MEHSILLNKLEFYRVSRKCTCSMVSIISYSPKTENLILVDGEVSDFCTLTCGIPQRSILGPLLFTLYINDFPLSQLYSRSRMYANNATLTSTAEDADTTCT